MPGNLSSKDQDTTSNTDDSMKTRRGSPVPQPPDVPDPSGSSSSTTHVDDYNPDQDLIGFGSQFDGSK
ncbi:hypothetical protein F5Y04DRAFT_279849 [Hypomontagnella monticulosa]|nr:hypothetical protein F5Y04DRAFT_279849 [Hypomontagnella monticulosa]